ncbi:caspase family protein [uncultured Roseibium sp.]|uniref:caspase family protein n=1 Tax=uncultured Roseibium sp. TaxID=1936171 RepID=UPI0025989A26|nr:caspase family protein [uncultured Roseibium sp.]
MIPYLKSIFRAVLFILVLCPFDFAQANENEAVFVKPDTIGSWGAIFDKFKRGPKYAKTFALVIGVSKYDHLEDLPTGEDPWEVADFLVQEAGYDHVHVLTDDAVTEDRVRKVLQSEFQKKMRRNDRLLIYWSGHGVTKVNRIGQEVGFLAVGSSNPDEIGSVIKMNDLVEWAEFIPADQVLIILDSCFSGLVGRVSMGETERLLEEIAQPSFEILTAGSANQITFAAHSLGGGAFTRALLEGLRGAADAAAGKFPKDGIVSTTELILYARKRVAEYAEDGNWDRRIRPARRFLPPSLGEYFFLSQDGKTAALEKEGNEVDPEILYGIPVHRKKVASTETVVKMSGTVSRSIERCNAVASSHEYSGNIDGENISFFSMPPTEALIACELAYQTAPNDPRIVYQYLRSLYRYALKNRDKTRYQTFKTLANEQCIAGQGDACYIAAVGHEVANFFEENNDPIALKLHNSACALGQRSACLNAAKMVRDGRGTPSDPKSAYIEISRLCNLGHLDACAFQSYSLAYGLGIESNPSRAHEIAVNYCRKDNSIACRGAAFLERAGLGTPQDHRAAHEYFQKSCALGSADSCRQAALNLGLGRGIEKDHAAALAALNELCAAADFEACGYVGYIFETSLPPMEDYDAARRNYNLGCDNGDGWSCARLGYLSQYGLGLEIDYEFSHKNSEKACARNNNWGCLRLAHSYRDGIGVEINPSKTASISESLCLIGYLDGCTSIGHLYQHGKHFEKNYLKASEIYMSACKLSNSWACSKLGYIYEDGKGQQKNLQSAYGFYSKGCELGDFWACYKQGQFLRDGIGVQEDDAAAFSLFTATCDLGDSTSCVYAGYMHETAQGTERNYELARELYEVGCDRKEGWGCGRLAYLYKEARGVEKNEHTAFGRFFEGCELGNNWSCEQTGRMYRDGVGTKRNYSSAHGIFEDLCEKRVQTGCTYLGDLYQDGLGVEVNFEFAVQNYQIDCDDGEAWGCSRLAYMHLNGNGVPKDENTAITLFERACDSGHHGSCRTLSNIYRSGERAPKDEGRALELALASCEKNDARSCYTAGDLIEDSDTNRKIDLFEKSCTLGNSNACIQVAESEYEIDNEPDRFIDILSANCESGGASSCERLGEYFLDKDIILDAYDWFSKGCDLGSSWSCGSEHGLVQSRNSLQEFLYAKRGCDEGRHADCLIALSRLENPISNLLDFSVSPIKASNAHDRILKLIEPINAMDNCVNIGMEFGDQCIFFAALPLLHNRSDTQIASALEYLEEKCSARYGELEACQTLQIWMFTSGKRAVTYRSERFDEVTSFCELRSEERGSEPSDCFALAHLSLSDAEILGTSRELLERVDWDFLQEYLLSACEKYGLASCIPLFELELIFPNKLQQKIPNDTIKGIFLENLKQKSPAFCAAKSSFSKTNIKILQSVLLERGHNLGSIDGIWGTRTSAAIHSEVGCTPI